MTISELKHFILPLLLLQRVEDLNRLKNCERVAIDKGLVVGFQSSAVVLFVIHNLLVTGTD